MRPVLDFLRVNIRDAARVCVTLFKIMIPLVIAIKLLQEAGIITILSDALSPVMQLFGLPGAMSIVWVTAMVTNLYGGAVVLVSLLPSNPLTAAQVTVLTTMMLFAHSLPVELGIARRCGARMRAQLFIRLGGAMLCGWLVMQGYATMGWGEDLVHPAWVPEALPTGWFSWAVGEARNLAAIAIIVTILMMLLDILKRLGITELFIRLLSPLLRIMGVGSEAGTITIVGITMGLSYGGGLIIHESRSGRIPRRDIFFALTFMGLTHSLIEDTLLMVLLGGELAGILWARVAFTVVVMWILVKIVSSLPKQFIESVLLSGGSPGGESHEGRGAGPP